MENQEEKLSPLDRFWKLLKPDKKEIKNVYTYGQKRFELAVAPII